jgi:hypothetical protein
MTSCAILIGSFAIAVCTIVIGVLLGEWANRREWGEL